VIVSDRDDLLAIALRAAWEDPAGLGAALAGWIGDDPKRAILAACEALAWSEAALGPDDGPLRAPLGGRSTAFHEVDAWIAERATLSAEVPEAAWRALRQSRAQRGSEAGARVAERLRTVWAEIRPSNVRLTDDAAPALPLAASDGGGPRAWVYGEVFVRVDHTLGGARVQVEAPFPAEAAFVRDAGVVAPGWVAAGSNVWFTSSLDGARVVVRVAP
jgi:hypothetical protein